jgi:hypothetical protein
MLNLLAFSLDHHSVCYTQNGVTQSANLVGAGVCITQQNGVVSLIPSPPAPPSEGLTSLSIQLGQGQLLLSLDQTNLQIALIQPILTTSTFSQSESFTSRPPIKMGSLDTIGGREMLMNTGDMRELDGAEFTPANQSASKSALCLFLNLLAFSLYIRREGNSLILESIPNGGQNA